MTEEKIGGVVPDIRTESGVVLETTGSTETSVSGSIGSDRHGRTYGSIGSTTVDRQKIWLKLIDGSESWFRWTGRDVPLRLGHKVSPVMVSGERHLYVVAIVNHTTKEYFLTFTHPDWVLNKIGANPKGWHWGVALATGLGTVFLALQLAGDNGFAQILAFALGSMGGLMFGAMAYLITGACVAPDRRWGLKVLLNQHCDEVLHKGFPDPAAQGVSEQEPSD